MLKNRNEKVQVCGNYNYLNFVRRNQQIVDEFRELSRVEKNYRSLTRKMVQTHDQTYKMTIQTDRYGAGSSQSAEKEVTSNPKSKQQISSLKEIIISSETNRSTPTAELPISSRNALDFNLPRPQGKKVQLYTRNLSIPSNIQYVHSIDVQQDFYSEIKFPKLKTRQNPQQKSQSEVLEKEVMKKIKQKEKQQKSKELSRDMSRQIKQILIQKQPPLSIDTSKTDNDGQSYMKIKLKNMKVIETPKNKINTKLLRTYYDYENFLELKDKVSQLVPSFKPIQPRRKQKMQPINLQSQLQQYLEAKKAKNYIKQSDSKKKLLKRESVVNQEPEIMTEQLTQTTQLSKQFFQKQSSQTINPPKSLPSKKQTSKGKKASSQSSILKKKQSSNLNLGFKSNGAEQTIYQAKINSYRQFLFLVNFAHRIYDPLILSDDPEKYKTENKYKFYVGKGNNGMLIKSLMKRRFWWVQVDEPSKANFVWTQLRINSFYQFERKGYLQNKYDKKEEDYIEEYTKISKKNKKFTKKNDKKNQNTVNKNTGILRGVLSENQKKIFTTADSYFYKIMEEKGLQKPEKMNKFSYRLKCLPENFLKPREHAISDSRMHNHFFQNYYIGNKKALFYNLKRYYDLLQKDVFKIIPLTFHIKKGVNDPEYHRFLKEYKRLKGQLSKAEKSHSSTKKLSKNVWIVKPGQLSNRGKGITVIDEIYELNSILKTKTKHTNGQDKTYIIQKYIQKPLLYKNRKFDIRHFMMISRLHGRLRAYWFSEGYIRTSSYEYDIEQIGDQMVHLTNDAIQKDSVSYGKYQQGNKLSYSQFQRYLDNTYPEKKYSFIDKGYAKMKEIATDAIKATYLEMDPMQSEHNFEIFGLDFMIDSHFNVWLIEVNTNPCLELSSGLLSRIIPNFIQNTFRLALDPIFPPTAHFPNSIKYFAPDNPMQRLQFELIFDESRDGKEIEELFKNAEKADYGNIDEDDETFENQGKQFELPGDLD